MKRLCTLLICILLALSACGGTSDRLTQPTASTQPPEEALTPVEIDDDVVWFILAYSMLDHRQLHYLGYEYPNFGSHTADNLENFLSCVDDLRTYMDDLAMFVTKEHIDSILSINIWDLNDCYTAQLEYIGGDLGRVGGPLLPYCAKVTSLEGFTHMDNLERLHMQNFAAKDYDMLARIPALTDVSVPNITRDTDFSFLGNLTQIKEIGLHSTDTDTVIAPELLSALTQLESLSLANMFLPDLGFLEGMDKLELLILTDCQIPDGDAKDIAALPSLIKLSIDNTPLANMEALLSIEFEWYDLDDERIIPAP